MSRPGRLLAGLGVERLPVILVSLVGFADGIGERAVVSEVVDAVIDDVAEMQLLGAGFRPVFLLDTPAFTRARSYGLCCRARHASYRLAGRACRVAGVRRRSGCIDGDGLWRLGRDRSRSRRARRRGTRCAPVVRISPPMQQLSHDVRVSRQHQSFT